MSIKRQHFSKLENTALKLPTAHWLHQGSLFEVQGSLTKKAFLYSLEVICITQANLWIEPWNPRPGLVLSLLPFWVSQPCFLSNKNGIFTFPTVYNYHTNGYRCHQPSFPNQETAKLELQFWGTDKTTLLAGMQKTAQLRIWAIIAITHINKRTSYNVKGTNYIVIFRIKLNPN